MPEFTVPDSPLPLPTHARVAVAGDDARVMAFADAFSGIGIRDVARFDGLAAVSRTLRPANFDVLFLTVDRIAIERDAALVAPVLQDKVVVNCVTARAEDARGYYMEPVPHGSVTGLCTHLFPESRVVGALFLVSETHISWAQTGLLQTDVPVVGDDREAADLVGALIDEIAGLNAVYMGMSRNAGGIEGLAALLGEAERQARHPVGIEFQENGGYRLLDDP